MSALDELPVDVAPPDTDAALRLRQSVPDDGSRGALARLEEWLAAVQSAERPRPPRRVRLVRLGDTQRPLPALLDDGTGVRDVDVASESDLAIRTGAAIGNDEIDQGADLLVLTVAAATLPCAVLVAVLTGTEPVKVMPRGTLLEPDQWMSEAQAVRDARRAAVGLRDRPIDLLGAVAPPALAAAVGLLLTAAARRTPVVLDGVAAATAALVAFELQPRAAQWWLPADVGPHPAHALAIARTGGRSVLGLGTGMDDGTAGLLAVEVLRASCAR